MVDKRKRKYRLGMELIESDVRKQEFKGLIEQYDEVIADLRKNASI